MANKTLIQKYLSLMKVYDPYLMLYIFMEYHFDLYYDIVLCKPNMASWDYLTDDSKRFYKDVHQAILYQKEYVSVCASINEKVHLEENDFQKTYVLDNLNFPLVGIDANQRHSNNFTFDLKYVIFKFEEILKNG